MLSITPFRYSREQCPWFCLQPFCEFVWFPVFSFNMELFPSLFPYRPSRPHIPGLQILAKKISHMIFDCNLPCTNILRENRGRPPGPACSISTIHLGCIKFLNSMFCCLKMLSIFLAVAALLSKQVLHCQKSQPKATVPYTLGWAWTKQWPENSNAELYNIWPWLQLSEDMSLIMFSFSNPSKMWMSKTYLLLQNSIPLG